METYTDSSISYQSILPTSVLWKNSSQLFFFPLFYHCLPFCDEAKINYLPKEKSVFSSNSFLVAKAIGCILPMM